MSANFGNNDISTSGSITANSITTDSITAATGNFTTSLEVSGIPVPTGVGTTSSFGSYVTKWTTSNSIGNSTIFDYGSGVAIGYAYTSPRKLYVGGSLGVDRDCYINGKIYLEAANSSSPNVGIENWFGDGIRMFMPSGGYFDLTQGDGFGAQRLRIDNSGNFVFNAQGYDCDFRVAGDTDANLLFTDASTDRVGIGTASPSYKLEVNGSFSSDSINVSGQYTFPTITGSVGDSLVYAGSNQVAWSGVSGALSGQLDGNLDLNNYDIVGTGNITIDGNVTAEYFYGDLDGVVITECRNDTGSTIAEGTPVYVAGYYSSNGKPLVAPADCANATKMPAIGLLASELTTGSEGHVHVFGLAQNLPSGVTNGFSVGNTVYVDNGGGLTNVRPTGVSELVQNIGRVLKTGTNGRILVLGPGRSNDVPNSGHFEQLTVDGYTALAVDNGNVGIGTALPSHKLHIADGTAYIQSGIISPTIAFRTYDIPLSGPTIYDGFIAYQNSDCWGLGNSSNDGFVFEKTDGNQNNPDGGIFFNVRGSGGVSSTAMSINGSKEIFIGQTGTYIAQGYSLNLKGGATVDSFNINNQFTFPTGDGTNSQVLATDGNGNVAWSGVSDILSGFSDHEVLTTSQQSFTVNGGYTVGSLDVYYNGLKLIDGDDYAATDGTSFLLSASAGAGDVIEWEGHRTAPEYATIGNPGNYRLLISDGSSTTVNAQNDLVYTPTGLAIGTTGTICRLTVADSNEQGLCIHTTGAPDQHFLIGRNTSTGQLVFKGTQSDFSGYEFRSTIGTVSKTILETDRLTGAITFNDQYTFPTGVGNVGDSLVYDGNYNVVWSGVSGGSGGSSTTSLGTLSVTSSQSLFNTTDIYPSGGLAVFLNGVKLVEGEDFEETSNTSFTLTSPAASGDIVEYIAYGSTIASTNLQKTGDTMTGNLTVNADLIVKGYKETYINQGNTGTSQTISITNSTLQTYTLTDNCIFTMPTPDAGRSFTMFLKTGTGGYSATFTGVKWPSSSAPTITTTASRMDILTFYSDGTNWYGNLVQEYTP